MIKSVIKSVVWTIVVVISIFVIVISLWGLWQNQKQAEALEQLKTEQSATVATAAEERSEILDQGQTILEAETVADPQQKVDEVWQYVEQWSARAAEEELSNNNNKE